MAEIVAGAPEPAAPELRFRVGKIAGVTGIAANLLLCAVKAAVGLVSGSVAVMADAVNNLSDAGASVVTLVGFHLASQPADDEHPFGHGRIEYVAGLIVAVIVIAVGLDFLKSSVIRIFKPEPSGMTKFGMILLASALPVKFLMFLFFRKLADKIQSAALRASALDSLSDILVTAAVIAAVILEHLTGWHCDGIAGVLVSLLVLRGGVEMIRDTVSPLLGEPDKLLAQALTEKILKNPDIKGIHELVIHNYGPGCYFATAHAEVDAECDPVKIHDSLESTEEQAAEAFPVRLVLHCDPFDSKQIAYKQWRLAAVNAALNCDRRLRIYDFRLLSGSDEAPRLSFHLLVPREFPLTGEELTAQILAGLRQRDPQATMQITFDNSFI